MLISDIMTTKVISISSTTTVAEARRIMEEHKIRRLPVIDNSKLVGVISKDGLDKMGPSQLTTFSVHEIVYLLNKITVKEIMKRDVVTVSPSATIEEAVAKAQAQKVGFLIIEENEKVIGVATTNDIFLGIFNPILGIGLPGSRILVVNCFKGPDIEKVISTLNRLKIGITNLFLSEFPSTAKHDLMVHLDTPDATTAAETIRGLGFSVIIRKR
jgi:acetoin utilization protein AcuB